MAFLRTFTALTVAALIWIGLFVEFGDIHNSGLNRLAEWISPNTVTGWVFYILLCVICFLVAQRFIGHSHSVNGSFAAKGSMAGPDRD